MGTRGPVPKRSEHRRRRNKDSATEVVQAPAAPVSAPPLDFPAHPIAEDWYRSLRLSGQARFFEPSDWVAARIIAFDLTRHLNSGRPSSQLFAALWSAMGDLLTTEASRRRVRVEVTRWLDGQTDDDEGASIVAEYKRALQD